MTAHPLRNPATERWLDKLNIAWTFDPAVPLDAIDKATSLANQVRHQPLDEATVERYAEDMRRGDVFPPGLLRIHRGKRTILGGLHRYHAHLLVGHDTAPHYILERLTARTALLASVEDNRHHGLPTTKADRVAAGIALMATGMKQGDAARAVGLTQPDLSIGAAVVDVAQRANRVRASSRFPRLPYLTRYQLSQIVDDERFKACADAVARTAMPLSSVTPLVRAVNAAATATEAKRLIAAEVADMGNRARTLAGNTRASSRTPRARFDGALTELCALSAIDVFDTCPEPARHLLADKIMDAIKVLRPAHDLLSGKVVP